MKKPNLVLRPAWIKLLTSAYSLVLIGYVVMLMTILYTKVSFAATTDGVGEFGAAICGAYQGAGYLVAILTVIMIVVAGISYGVSAGRTTGELSVTSAKGMIISAVTGAFLYMLGFILLGNQTCDGTRPGLIRDTINGSGINLQQSQGSNTPSNNNVVIPPSGGV